MARVLDWGIKEDTPPSLTDAGEDERRRSVGRLSGALFVAGALAALPSVLTLDTEPEPWVYVVIAVAFVAGLFALWVPWDRIAAHWLHAPPLAGVTLITLGILGTHARGNLYAWLYVLTVVVVACEFRSRAVVGGYLGLIALCSAAPLLDSATSASDTGRALLVSIPSLAITAAVVTYLRERLEAGRSAYQQLAQLDPLTGVGNYRTLYERLEYEIARHERHHRRFAVMLIDLNRFKQVNDELGHLAGDRVLREVGRALAHTVRDQDTVARQGGDEFSVLAPETSPVEMMTLARRIHEALAHVTIGDRAMTASMGWAVFPDDGHTAHELVAAADDALMAGKARWLPEHPGDFWPEHLRQLSEGTSPAAQGASGAKAAS